MDLWSHDIRDGETIAPKFAFGKPDATSHVALSDNLSPHLAWSGAPVGTRSFAISVIDADVPTKPDDVNVEGRTVPADLARTEFVHWLMCDIPAGVSELEHGACSSGITAGGKRQPAGPDGAIQGRNDYTAWFAGDADMEGEYLGYDGPCPPWNDERIHHYSFCVYALDTETVHLRSGFTLADFRKALEEHTLGRAELTVKYSLNPNAADGFPGL